MDIWQNRQWCERCKRVVKTTWIVKRRGLNTGTYTIGARCLKMLKIADLVTAAPPSHLRFYDYADTLPAGEWEAYNVEK